MANPTLHLIFSKGPKEGETLECKPGTRTRIGRVVRGNTLAVKDPGISQKHLLFEFIAETSRWAVCDLDTVNGTILNSALIPPTAPTPLADGDTIKIGETTAISVKIAGAPSPELNVPVLRGRRPARVAKEEESIDVEEKLGRGKRPLRKAATERAPVTRVTRSKASKTEEPSDPVPVQAEKAAMTDPVPVQPEMTGPVPVQSEKAKMTDLVPFQAEKAEMTVEINAGNGDEFVGRGEGESASGTFSDDMDNMTLREWFDRMEVYLPRAINDYADELIRGLRETSQRFDEFIANRKD